MTLTRPLALDYFCCQGAASYGFHLAGFQVDSVDIAPQPHFWPGGNFIQADAISHLRELITSGGIRRYSLIGGSPPCQRHTKCQRIQKREHPDFIETFRELCQESGLPYIIENVEGAPLKSPALLCGSMFPGLNTYRHRLFESNLPLWVPEHPEHIHHTVKMGRPLKEGDWYHAVGNFSNVPYVRANMGVPWMTRNGIRECIPPAFAEHFGRQALAYI